MKKHLIVSRISALALCVMLAIPAFAGAQEAVVVQPELVATSVEILTVGDYQFKDLNKNGSLDAYEDWRLTAQERTADLLSQMTAEEKAAQMIHLTMVTLKETWFSELNIGFALVYTYLSEGVESAVEKTNQVQALSEEARLGIPAVLSMDSIIGASWINGTTVLPDQITLAATRDVQIVKELANIQREEMRALGVRMSLSPVADIATDPRWGRVQECFGEDAELATEMLVAAIEGLQNGNSLTPESVMTCVKHFPGAGPQTAGVDGTPLVYDDETFQIHLNVFKAAIAAGASAIMPYGYSTVPYLGGDAVENYAHESSTVMTDLLRNELGYEGIIQTDWGLNHTFAALAGADALGGAGQREISKLAENLTMQQLDERVARLLNAKFELGLFENPYNDLQEAKAIVGSDENYAAVKNAAAKAMTLVKYENMQPLKSQKLIIAGTLAEDANALSSGWKTPDYAGQNLLTAITNKAGSENVTYIGDDLAQVAQSYPEGTTAIVVIGETSGTHEPAWGTNTLMFPDEQAEMVEALGNAGIPVVAVVLMNRAYVMTDVAEQCDAVLLAYRPGITAGADAVTETLFGETPITGKTPFQIPASMSQVLMQREDVAKDIVDPLYDYGFGIEVASFGQ